jgi:hypothetical protein
VDALAALEPQRKSDRVGKVAGISGREVSTDRAQAPSDWILLEPTAPENVVFVGGPLVAKASSPRRRVNALHELLKLGLRSCMFAREGGEHDQQRSAYCHDQHSARG